MPSNAQGTRYQDDYDDDSVLSPAVDQESESDQGLLRGPINQGRRIFNARLLGTACACLNAFIAGSITCFSVYGYYLQEELKYPQSQVNKLWLAAVVSTYLMAPIFGLITDSIGTHRASALSGTILGASYFLARLGYKSGIASAAGGPGWPFPAMFMIFMGIGVGTGFTYSVTLTYCAKAHAHSSNRTLALAWPNATFGISGFALSKLASASSFFLVPGSGDARPAVDVAAFLLFLGCFASFAGLLGYLFLSLSDVLDLDDDDLPAPLLHNNNRDDDDLSADLIPEIQPGSKTDFLLDPGMWLLSAGFLIVVGACESYINNIGSIVRALYPASVPSQEIAEFVPSGVMGFALMSTAGRFLAGFVLRGSRTTPLGKGGMLIRQLGCVGCLIYALARLALGVAQGDASVLVFTSWLVGLSYGFVFGSMPVIITTAWSTFDGKSPNFGFQWGTIAMMPAIGSFTCASIYSYYYQQAAERHARTDDIDLPPIDGSPAQSLTCYGQDCYSIAMWRIIELLGVALMFWLVCIFRRGGWAYGLDSRPAYGVGRGGRLSV